MRPRAPLATLLALSLCALAAAGCGGTASGVPQGSAQQPPKKAVRSVSKEDLEKQLDKRMGAAPQTRTGDSPVRLVDVTKERGIDFIQDNGWSDELYYVELLGSGVMMFDADNDSDMDLYFMNGKHIAPPLQVPAPVDRLYLNDGKGRFTDGTAASGLGDTHYTQGVCAADFDNDGDQDVYITNWDDPNAFFLNDGKGHFKNIAKAAGVEGRGATDTSCTWGDMDRDGFVDLFVSYYVDHSRANNIVCEEALRDGSGIKHRYCNPKDYKEMKSTLYRNRGNGTFEDYTAQAGLGEWKGRALSADFCDFDNDGDPDLFVACDRSANGFFVNDGKGHFTDIGMTNGTALSDEGKAQAGMGSTVGDFDEDGLMDVAATYFEREPNGIYKNLGNNQFQNISVESGTARPSFFLLAWGTEFFDADLDSHLDWMVVNGHVLPNAELFREPVAGYEQPKLLFLGRGDGTFENLAHSAGPGMVTERVARGLATGDIDGDGDLDVVVENIHAAPELLLNDSPRAGKHWLMAKLTGTKSNRDAIGARLTLHLGGRKLIREVKAGQSYLSQSDMRVHWGLGEAATVPLIEIRWPSGATSRLENVAADQVLAIREP